MLGALRATAAVCLLVTLLTRVSGQTPNCVLSTLAYSNGFPTWKTTACYCPSGTCCIGIGDNCALACWPCSTPGSTTSPGCTTAAECAAPTVDGETSLCRSGTCIGKCPALSSKDGSEYVPLVLYNQTFCMPACVAASSPAGVAECTAITEKIGLNISAFCQSILTLGGYSSSPSSYLDSKGIVHNFTGTCTPCQEGQVANAAGDGCTPGMVQTAALPSPPPQSGSPPSAPPEKPTTALAPSTPVVDGSPPSNDAMSRIFKGLSSCAIFLALIVATIGMV